MGNPRRRLLVPGRAVRATCGRWGRGATLRFIVSSGGDQRARGRVRLRRAARRRSRRARRRDASGSSATSGTARSSRGSCCGTRGRARRTRSRCSGEPEDYLRGVALDRASDRAPDAGRAATAPEAPVARTRVARPPRPEPAGGARATRSRPAATVLAVCADVPRRLSGLARRTGGFALITYDALERDPRIGDRFEQLVALDPPADAEGAGAARALAAGLPIWRGASLSYALHSRCTSWSTVSVLRSWPSTEPSGAGEGDRRGARAPASWRRSARSPGTVGGAADQGPRGARARQPRPGSAGPGARGRRADGAGALAGVQGLRSAVRGRSAIPEQRKSSARRLSRDRQKDADGLERPGRGGLAAVPELAVADRSRRPPGRARPRRSSAPSSPPAEQRLLGDLFAIVEEHADQAAAAIDRDRVEEAFVYACVHHADQRRRSGEDFIIHPVGVAKICAGMRLDTETLCAALLHDTVEDTSASLEEVHERVRRGDRRPRRRRHQADRADVPVARRGAGRELPQDDGRDGLGHPGHPDQARRSPAQHAHDRRDAQAEADREGARDARHLRADRPPARHPRDQVGARGPRVPDAAPAQVQRDQGAGRPAARRARALRQPGRRRTCTRSSTSSASTPRSPAAPSTSTRSTRR